jgi:vacuole morphology and inheritance protein 14
LAGLLSAALPWLQEERLKGNYLMEVSTFCLAGELNTRLTDLIDPECKINVNSVVEVLLTHMTHPNTETRIASLNWIRLLHSNMPAEMFNFMDRFFPVLLDLLQDSADDVLMLDIMLITDICSKAKHNINLRSFNLSEEVIKELDSTSPYLVKFCISLLSLFKSDSKLLEDRGIQIIR